MSDQEKGPAYQFLQEDTTADGKKGFRCTVRQDRSASACNQWIGGLNISNFERHLSRRHPSEFKIVSEEKKETRKRKAEQESEMPSRKKQKTLNGVVMSMEEIVDCCISLVSDSLRPFAAIDDPGLQRLIRPYLDAMPQGERRAVSAESIRMRISERADSVKEKLRQELSGRMICLKVDSASRTYRNFLGINAQFVSGGKLVLRTLATLEVKRSCTAVNLKETILTVLDEHGVRPENVYSVTSDNGANMVLAGRLLGELAEDILALTADEDYDDDGDVDDDDEDIDVPSDDEEDLPLSAVRERLVAASGSADAVHGVSLLTDDGEELGTVRCAAHCLQLAVKDALKTDATEKLLLKMRRVAKKLRTKNNAQKLKSDNFLLPALDNDTRWSSTQKMLESLLPLRDFITQYSRYLDVRPPTARDWDLVGKLVEGLLPAKIAMKRLQEEQLVVGDFYGAWLTCKLDTKKVNTAFAKRLEKAMCEREGIIMKDPAVLAALYLDPRYSKMLRGDDVGVAERQLLRLWGRLERLDNTTQLEQRAADAPPDAAQGEQVVDGLEELLRARDLELEGGANTSPAALVEVMPRLKWHLGQPRLPTSVNPLEYWEKNRFKLPVLFRLATVALAVPATQVSVERLFSGMKHLLGDKRLTLTDQVVNQLMSIRQYNLYTLGPPKNNLLYLAASSQTSCPSSPASSSFSSTSQNSPVP